MYHDTRLAAPAQSDARPRSAVSHGAGFAGLTGLAAWLVAARLYRLDGPLSALVGVAAAALPMVLWSLAVDRVHRLGSTGLNWAEARPWRASFDDAALKIVGTWVTWALIAVVYAAGRFWWQPPFLFAMNCLLVALPVLAGLSIPYFLWLERHLVDARDGAWYFGAWIVGRAEWNAEAIRGHLAAWAVKGFFLPFMLAILPGGFGAAVRTDVHAALADPVAMTGALTGLMFTLDVVIATAGYMLTLRPLDAHIRSANPFAAGWTAALICYPPFELMIPGGPLDYHPGTAEWSIWLAGHPWLLWCWGALLVGLTAIYAWATMAFGPRFSNLTNRGILTHGPYAWSRHPAYLSKNLFWLASTLPFLTTGNWLDGARATVLMAAVAGTYYWRARTEERHLLLDPDYQAYHGWMSRHGAVPRLVGWVLGWPA